MSRKPEPEVFSKAEQLSFQQRFSSFLRDYESRSGFSGIQMAELLDIAPQKYSYVKSSTKPYSKLINSLGFLNRIATLKGFSIAEFVSLLDGGLEVNQDEIPNWLKNIYKSFERLPYNIRNNFVDICRLSSKDNFRKLSILLEIVHLLSEKDYNSLKSLRIFIGSYESNKEIDK